MFLKYQIRRMIHIYFFVITSYLVKIELVNIISNNNVN